MKKTLSEFSIIDQYCQNLGTKHPETKLSVGDDAAVIAVPQGYELAVSVDTLVAGVHFPLTTTPANIAHKLLAVNLSDLAAMGAQPRWATVALTLANNNAGWLRDFSNNFNHLAKQFNVELIGGDTTQGPLSLTLQIMGLLPQGQALTRGGAKIDDDVYVTGSIGDAALGLQLLLSTEAKTTTVAAYQLDQLPLLSALNTPTPRIQAGQALLPLANSCIDVSDGLLADLMHIADRSNVSINIAVEEVPLSSQYQQYRQQGGNYDLALTGGDDYELAFTAAPSQRTAIQSLAQQQSLAITRIGQVVAANKEPQVLPTLNNQYYQPAKQTGFEHFSH